MKIYRHGATVPAVVLLVVGTLLGSGAPLSAHCDSLDGPIVPEARRALEKGDPTVVLKWVPAEGEDEVRRAFHRAYELRAQGDEVRELADQWFLETLIRVHRAGEGEAYTGLKPEGSIAAIFVEADAALVENDVQSMTETMAGSVRRQIEERFERAVALRAHANESVAAGRRFVEAYVDYMHFLESLDRLLENDPHSEPGRHQDPHGH